jgi:ABC-type transport system substrate-binding protein
MTDRSRMDETVRGLTTATMNRRKLLKMAGIGVSALTVSSLLSACADDDDVESADDEAGLVTDDTADDSDDAADTDDADETEEEIVDEPDDDTDDGDEEDTAEGGQVTVLWRTPTIMHPLFSTAGGEQQVQRLMFGALVKMNHVLEPVPDLAETIEATEDALTYTFVLHDGIEFNDGEPLTSDDVRFTLERGIHPNTASYWRGRLSSIAGSEGFGEDGETEGVEGISTPDDLTIEITLSEPEAAFLPNLCNFSGLGILPKHILEDVAPEEMREHPFSMEPTVTAGAFQFVRYETDQFLELERNENYFGERPPLDRIFCRILEDSVGVAQLETGDLDIMTLPYSEIERTEEMDHVSIESVPSPMLTFLAINMTEEKLQNKELRQAMAWAIDRQGIVDAAKRGHGVVRHSPIFGPEWMGVPEGLTEYEHDPDRARELLEEAGWDPDDQIEIVMGAQEADARKTAVTIIQEQWREVGINSNIVEMDTAELNERTIQNQNFEVRPIGGGVFGADPSISGTYFRREMFTPEGGNYGHYYNEEVDELYIQGQSTGDLDERREIYTQIAQILNDELPWIFLYSPNSIHAVSNRVNGFEAPGYVDNKFWNAEEWSVSD